MITGDVFFDAAVDARGRVKSVDILRVPREDMGFEEAVKNAVQTWRFDPARRNGHPIDSVYLNDAWTVTHAIFGTLREAAFSDSEPVLVSKPQEPSYPQEARRKRVQGEVVLSILVLRDGSTEVIEVLQGPDSSLVEASLANAVQWRWKPGLKHGKPVEVRGIISVHFYMDRIR